MIPANCGEAASSVVYLLEEDDGFSVRGRLGWLNVGGYNVISASGSGFVNGVVELC